MRLKCDLTCQKIAAGDQATIFISWTIREQNRLHLAMRRSVILGDIEGRFNVQLTGGSSRCEPTIVVHTVGDIRIFLQFIEEHSGAERMHRSSRYKNHISRVNHLFMK